MFNTIINLLWALLYGLLGAFVYVWFTNYRKAREERKAKENPKEETLRPVPEFAQVIEGKRYNTMDAHCIAQGSVMFGWMWLMQTQKNNYFVLTVNMFGVGEITVRTQDQAIQFFTQAPKREVKFEDAFPDVKIVDA